MRRALLPLLALVLLAALLSCSKKMSQPQFGTVVMRMTDAPAAFDAVNLVVDQVSIHRAGDGEVEPGDSLEIEADDDSLEAPDDSTDTEGGWDVLQSAPQSIDLLALRNGVTTTLGTGTVLAGHYTQIRLKLGAGSNVVVDGTSHPLIVPSGMQSGLKLIGPFNVPAGQTTDVTLDFDAASSVILEPDGSYRLQPTIKIVH